MLAFAALTLCAGAGCGDSQAEPADPAIRPQLVFRLALELKPETVIWEASNLFKQEIEKASPEDGIAAGEIMVEFYDRGMIGTERQLLEACYFGVIEVVQINSSVVTTVEPTYGLLDLPYVFVDESHHERVLNGPIGEEMLAALHDHGFEGLSFYCLGFRNMFYKSRDNEPCADTPSDLAGKKIRVMESPVMIDSVNAIGPIATPLSHSELYQSLRTGVVDGAENSARIFMSEHYYETGCNCFTLTEHFTNQHVMIASRSWLEGLPTKYQKRIREAARQVVPAFNDVWDGEGRKALAEMQEKGVTVNRVADKVPFFERVTSVANDFFKRYPTVPRELYDRIRAAAESATSAQLETDRSGIAKPQ
jgi:TRAP-type C4-dicarboxylate transport system substrate-binding protein